ncbi:acetyl/propionyl/methylcrotonyl-CoA carboxylase subunit alpha [Leifsonia sp. Leaf264]|uniref:acetyl/propionyl/methylcrotonyl-CoA carboxylase subunit alpha n=1 Tax=Leifsonia sp. Leaf264 TaxID=1736314 RepID=UPI0006FB9635|nr:biotin carboxylase N-terminal domain-containing protein [Leifsonia sp. Leaf264]KQO99653.1 acetyl/propionyl-CoA carboxylase subuit alpha [Leifsonia sp. Leaf264]
MTIENTGAAQGAPLFHTVLVANRGEIAVRVIRTLRRLGIRSVAVYSDADADAVHVRLADTAVRLGPADARESYLDGERVISAALGTGAQAIHPGYGFLSENEAFAAACEAAGIVFIGPGEQALEVMGDKIRAKLHVAGSAVPVVPGVSDASLDDAALADAALGVGFPLLIKPSAGGGGKGMQLARAAEELPEAIAGARRVAASAFGDDTLLLERYIEQPRHIEVQVLADAHGAVVHLGERECSLQRRHQKVIEEAPSPLLDAETRERIGRAACDAARSVDYRGAGTVEFLVSASRPDDFFFIEMNTRLQVEHPVTELVTGFDLVEQQLRVAAGEPLAFAQSDVRLTGHAIEARVYAESPERGFLPSTGTVLAYAEPQGAGIRIDSGIAEGSDVGSHYDPMLAKVIAHGSDRVEALARLDAALADTVVLGVDTNIAFLRTLIADPAVQSGDLDTGLIDRMPPLSPPVPSPELLAEVAAALGATDRQQPGPASPLWRSRSGFRLGTPRPRTLTFLVNEALVEVAVASQAGLDTRATQGQPLHRTSTTLARSGSTIWVHSDSAAYELTVLTRAARLARSLAAIDRVGKDHSPELRAPMPGTVTAVHVADGDEVEAGQAIVSIEAMKMEHRVSSPINGRVSLATSEGALVRRDDIVASVTPIATSEKRASE